MAGPEALGVLYGRVIFRLKDQTEFARIVFNRPVVEDPYDKLPSPNDSEFDQSDRILMDSVTIQIKHGLPVHSDFENLVHITVRDSDDNEIV